MNDLILLILFLCVINTIAVSILAYIAHSSYRTYKKMMQVQHEQPSISESEPMVRLAARYPINRAFNEDLANVEKQLDSIYKELEAGQLTKEQRNQIQLKEDSLISDLVDIISHQPKRSHVSGSDHKNER